MTAIIVFAPLDCLGVRLYAADGAFAYSKLAGILQLAIEHNAIISAARERVEQSRADVRISGARMAPSVTGGVGAAWNDASQGASRNVYNASLNLSQTIFAGGSLVANKRAADLELSAVKAEGVRTYQGVLNSARSNYYDCLRAYARMHVAEESLNLSKEHLKQAEALYKAGMVPRGDVLRVKTSVSQGDLDRIDAENDLNVSWTALERAAGMNISMGDVLEPLSGDAISELTPPEFDLSGDIVQRALSQRPEIKAYEFYSERAKQLVKSASGQRLPNIVLSGQLGITDDSFWPTDEDTWRVQIQLQWTLFDSGEISAQVKKAKASAQELLYQLEDLASQIRQEVV
ncbi:MAG: TolC family protein, partial [Synergistaceae bacterium]|nr:TolC family protein [Synergistaceae bacterium]